MTMAALAASYHHSADLLRTRIKELKAASKTAAPSEKTGLEHRLRELRIMYRETRATARVLEHYYDRRRRRNEDIKKQ